MSVFVYPEESLFEVDSLGLGGRKKKTIDDLGSKLLDSTLRKVKRKDKEVAKTTVMPHRVRDVFAYYADLDKCLQQISTILKPNSSHCCFVVANRTVRRITMPTDKIIIQLAKKYGFRHKETLYRTIANKAMSSKNAPENISDYAGKTMTHESIIVWEY